MQTTPITLALTLGLATLIVPASPRRAPDVDDYYERILNGALERAEAELLKRSDFFVEHSTWEQAFVVTSEHYRIKAVGSRSAANKLLAGLEFMLAEFQRVLATDFTPAQRFQIDVLPIDEYNARGNNAAEHSSYYGSYLEANGGVAISYTPNSEYLGILGTHSACHQFVAQAFGRQLPYWVSEGLAAYFATFWNPEWSKSELKRVAGGPAWIGMRQLLSGRAADYLNDGNTRLIQLGMLFKYLIEFNPETGEGSDSPFVNFLRASVRGQRGDTTRYSQRALQAYEQDYRDCEY